MKKILVVDNHPLMLKFMTDLLTKKGYQVKAAQDGLTALNILKSYIPAVIFIDLVMPNIGGIKLCQIIRRMPELRDVYLIILSAIAAEEKIDPAEFGADICIAKGPFNEMAQNVLDALDRQDQGISPGPQGTVIGVENIHSREITRELLSIKKHFEVILGSMSEGILEITPEARVVYANPAALALIDKPEEELLASNFGDLFYETDHQRIKDLFGQELNAPRSIPEDSPVRLNDRQISLNLVPLKDKENKIIVILNDVTDRRRMEVQLQQIRKMEAVGTLAGGIAHDFNNLLMGIQGNASLMLLDVDSTHPHHKRLNNIVKLVQSGSKLTRQLLGYARKGRYEVKPINLNQLVEETSETFGRTKKEVAIHQELAEDLFPIEADQGQIEQVLLNMYVNAWQAMPDGGDLFLKTMNTTHEEMKGKLYEPKPGNYVLLAITDTGVGIDKNTRERIFDPFFTTKEMGRGTGLGLASVYGIIKGHGGYIDVDSEKGRGTTFSICLPASPKEAIEKKELHEEALKGTETVLLIDDEDMIIDVGKQMLEALGYEVLIARSSSQAIDVYNANKDRIDMVILDMIMPDMNGGEIYDRLKQINPSIKVLLSSGYSIDGQATKILERGCNGFIQKPFNMEQISGKIREILDKK
ncbi:MAG: response regulator [Deltaproteobacteria bacterium]|nr:response regulator [Deltaproteobacteria bacterium]